MCFRRLATALVLLFSLTAQAKSDPPNVLLIAVDDLNDWVGCLDGHPQTHTPNIDQLAKTGMLFSNAHCQGTMCNPSRISVLWGMRPSTTGFYGNHYPVSKEPDFLKTHTSLPAYFKQHGYITLTAGKVFHTTPYGQPDIIGPMSEQWRKGHDKRVQDKPKHLHKIWDFGPQDYKETEFVDHIIADWAIKQLGESRDKPFFLSVGFYRPHVPFFSPRRVYDTFKDIELPPIKKDDWADLPEAARELTLSNKKIPTHEWMLEQERWPLAVHAYLACVRWTDEQVGRVLKALEDGPNANNTVVVLFSDHGYHLGEKQRWSKFSLWERTTRVPLIIRLPNRDKVRAGKTDAPVELLSLYPTLTDICGLPANQDVEGISLTKLLADPKAPWDHVAVSTLGQNNHAVRSKRWRYIRYADGSEELYDHNNDPNEWDNLAYGEQNKSHRDTIEGLKQYLPKSNAPQRGSK